ncbi:hypothetical protein MFRU_058g00290 [Monilinia fructicola]|nr:hypothetical protein MFRU_058g00290 [Monilinia fructicola]
MPFVCSTCNEEFGSKRELICHCQSYEHIPAWICEHCDKAFGSENALEQHAENKHKFWCYPCGVPHYSEDSLDLHNRTHHTLPCMFGCGKTFAATKARDQHNNDVHNYRCVECDLRFTSRQSFDEHEAAYHDFKCDPCEREFRSQSAFEQHVNSSAHSYRCSKCNKSFPFNSSLQQHITADHTWKCDQCQLLFDGPNHLSLHKKYEHLATKCLICPAKFDNSAELHLHKTQQHSFQCKYCTMLLFESYLLLRQHESNSHKSQCTACSRLFRLDTTPKRHFEEAHGHKCPECNVECNTLDLLKNNQPPHHHHQVCPSCGETFTDTAAHDLHCTNARRLNCPKCSETFKTVEEVLQHALRHIDVVIPGSTASLEQSASAKAALDKQLKYGRNTCERCGGMFLKRLDLEHHLANDHGLQMKCPRPSCDHTSTSLDGFRVHYLSCSMVKCQTCEGFFDKDSDPALKTHMAKAHSPKPVFGCVQCTETFESPDAVEKHFSREHGFGCEACPDIFFLTSAARDSHLATCSILLANSDSGDSYQTSRTNFSPVLERKTLPAVGVSLPFKSAQPLIQIDDEPNVDRYHAANQLAQKILSEAKAPPKLALRCKECKAPPFDNKVDFDQHVEHSPFHGPRQLTCHECNMTFETQLALLTHIVSKPHNIEWVLSMIVHH